MNSLVFSRRPRGEVIAYDLRAGQVVDEVTNYSIWLVDINRRDSKTVAQNVGHIARFWVYLASKRKSLLAVTDGLLRDYRDKELLMVLSNPRSRGSERAAKLTVNQKISAILNWLLWLQCTDSRYSQMIGPSGRRVTASPGARVRNPNQWAPGQGITSPLLFRGAGTSGSIPQATREMYEGALAELELMTASDYIAARDKVFLDIATTSGFRRGSICSLTVDQFDAQKIRRATSPTMAVKPTIQKFNYEDVYQVDTLLMLRVLDFIEGHRASLLVDLGLDRSDVALTGHIFLSATTGQPMTDRAMTARISRAMRKAGALKGMAIHAHRGLFAAEATQLVVEERRQLGMDTSAESVAHQVAPMLGHKNVQSQVRYTAVQQGRIGREILAKQRMGKPDSH